MPPAGQIRRLTEQEPSHGGWPGIADSLAIGLARDIFQLKYL